jgi:hypothetical protein
LLNNALIQLQNTQNAITSKKNELQPRINAANTALEQAKKKRIGKDAAIKAATTTLEAL